ncbi:MAG TPA: 4-alpha-glucanotransferase [Porphyromonadaceae bacterium]|nr:4-alpha-glucanotransferase [Porphyromonadaceae bacterium]
MNYLKFDRSMLTNLEQSLQLEMFKANRQGAYHCSTVVDCNTRKYHGLLVVPVPELGEDNHVLLSSLDETVIQHGAEFNLGLHKYSGYNFSPRGHKYIREFNYDAAPKTIYRVGGVIIEKERLLVTNENRFIIKYTLLESHSDTTIKFRPFLAFRNANYLTCQNNDANTRYEKVENGVSMCLYKGYPSLYMQFSKEPNYVSAPDWYKGIEYPKEMERGYDYKEDLLVPGYFEVPIEKGESLYFSAGTSPIGVKDIAKLYEEEYKLCTPRSSMDSCLSYASDQFLREKGENMYIVAGYPWFKVRARDQFIALPGCTLSVGKVKEFERIMATSQKALEAYMMTGRLDATIKEIDKPDILLWVIWALQRYANEVGIDSCVKKYGEFISRIVDYISTSKHPNLKVRENGLLFSEGKYQPVTWMNSQVDGHPIVPRTGYIVEFNALWYNDLMFSAVVLEKLGRKDASVSVSKMAERVKESFRAVFTNDCGYLFDYVNPGDYPDYSVRPNMVFATALEYSPLERTEKKHLLDFITKELLTPKGLRTLSPKSGGYNPYCAGSNRERDLAYHQGTAWTWLMAFYFEAYLKIFGKSGALLVERMMANFDVEMRIHCIGTISELFDGNPPYHTRGAISFAVNVASMLSLRKILKSVSGK